MHNNEQMIKPEHDSKVEKPHLLLPLNRKRKKNLHNTQYNTTTKYNGRKYNSNKKQQWEC